MPMWNKMMMQNSNSPLMEHLLFFHDHTMLILTVVVTMTINSMAFSYMNTTKMDRFIKESDKNEMFWTSFPSIMLIFIAIPSLKTLYLMEETMMPSLTVKTMGFQWYWSYEYSNIAQKKFNSLIYATEKMRSISTSNNLVVPINTPTRMMITSKDVLHSWTIPSLGLKSDAMPGRMNQLTILTKRPSIMVGQCSEICGAGHSFMPIYMESPSLKTLLKTE